MRAWMQTYTGKKFSPLEPDPEDMCIEDIAHGLAMTCRYGGHTRRFYSVAEHCVHVSRNVPVEFAREGLLHDTAECWIGDMIRPLKYQDAMLPFRQAERAIEDVVIKKFRLRTDSECWDAVKRVDDRILIDEVRALMRYPELYLGENGNGQGGTLVDPVGGALGILQPLGCSIIGMSPGSAEAAFLERFHQLFRGY